MQMKNYWKLHLERWFDVVVKQGMNTPQTLMNLLNLRAEKDNFFQFCQMISLPAVKCWDHVTEKQNIRTCNAEGVGDHCNDPEQFYFTSKGSQLGKSEKMYTMKTRRLKVWRLSTKEKKAKKDKVKAKELLFGQPKKKRRVTQHFTNQGGGSTGNHLKAHKDTWVGVEVQCITFLARY